MNVLHEDADQVRGQGSRVVNGDGKRPRVENEAAPGDTTDKSEDVDPEAKTPGDRCAGPGTNLKC